MIVFTAYSQGSTLTERNAIRTYYSNAECHEQLSVSDSIISLYKLKFDIEKQYSDSLFVQANEAIRIADNIDRNCKKQLARKSFWNNVKSGIIYTESAALIILGLYVFSPN